VPLQLLHADNWSMLNEQRASPGVFLAELLAQAPELPVQLNAVQLAAFETYAAELLSWNARFNLTAITDPKDIAIRHFLDSLSLLLVLPDDDQGAAHSKRRMIDVGTGAGFPGVPLAIVRPRWSVTLLEATRKKIRFLEHLVAALKLQNVSIVTGRAEEVGHDRQYRGQYDIVVARGLATLPVLLEYCAPFCRPGGLIVAPKKGDITAEIAQGRRAAVALGAAIREVRPVTLPGLTDNRVVVVAEQRQPVSPIYPRAAGVLRKRPLGSTKLPVGYAE